MGLQVWLPLNGNLNNLGYKSITTTFCRSSNNVLQSFKNEDGKTGKYLDFTERNYFYKCDGINLGEKVSICCWVKRPAETNISGNVWSFINSENRRICFLTCSSEGKILLNAGDGGQNPFRDESNVILTVYSDNKWHHYAVIFESNVVKLYIDGIYKGHSTTYRNPNIHSSKKYILLGGGYYEHDIVLNSANIWDNNVTNSIGLVKICDFRIYDHCLSAQEVKKISQGLVIHYPFDNRGFGKENLLIGSNDFSGWVIDNGGRWTVNNNIAEYSAGALTWQSLSSPTILWSSVEGKDITFSCEVRSDNSVYTEGQYLLYCQIGRKGIATGNYGSRRRTLQGLNINTSGSVSTTWKKYSRTIKNIQDSSFTGTYNGGGGDYFGLWFWGRGKNASVQIKNIKLQISEIPTPWNFNSSDTKYTVLGLNDTRIADISGFGNNGIRNNITYDYLTKVKYGKSAVFNGNNSVITLGNISNLLQDNFTINLWFCKKDLGTKNYETLIGGPSGFEMDTRASTATTLSLFMTSTRGGSLFTPFNFSKWYMVTMVCDNINQYYYINGDLVSTIPKKGMPSGNYFIGAWRDVSSQNYKGSISDFRLYTTALSADDIKELYNYNNPIVITEEEGQDVGQEPLV